MKIDLIKILRSRPSSTINFGQILSDRNTMSIVAVNYYRNSPVKYHPSNHGRMLPASHFQKHEAKMSAVFEQTHQHSDNVTSEPSFP